MENADRTANFLAGSSEGQNLYNKHPIHLRRGSQFGQRSHLQRSTSELWRLLKSYLTFSEFWMRFWDPFFHLLLSQCLFMFNVWQIFVNDQYVNSNSLEPSPIAALKNKFFKDFRQRKFFALDWWWIYRVSA